MGKVNYWTGVSVLRAEGRILYANPEVMRKSSKDRGGKVLRDFLT